MDGRGGFQDGATWPWASRAPLRTGNCGSQAIRKGNEDRGWKYEVRFSVAKRRRKSRMMTERARKEQNRGMAKALSIEETKVLKILADVSPAAMHLHEVGQKVGNEMGRAVLLETVDHCLRRGMIEGRPLRGLSGLEEAANLRITAAELLIQGGRGRGPRHLSKEKVGLITLVTDHTVFSTRSA